MTRLSSSFLTLLILLISIPDFWELIANFKSLTRHRYTIFVSYSTCFILNGCSYTILAILGVFWISPFELMHATALVRFCTNKLTLSDGKTFSILDYSTK